MKSGENLVIKDLDEYLNAALRNGLRTKPLPLNRTPSAYTLSLYSVPDTVTDSAPKA
jgi:hypothetical protein